MGTSRLARRWREIGLGYLFLAPAMLLLLAWSIRYSIRGLADTEPPELQAA